ncbi:MAG: hypothetical protein MJY60_08385, partial [Bacteroidales bacterium]|nr:hypothetical protein [Bacteroidales bacterium]
MKKTIIPLMVAFMLPFACTQIEEPSITPAGDDGTLIVISATSSPLTRTALDEDNSVSFLQTDSLSVFCQIDEENFDRNIFTVSRLYDDGSADFQGHVASTDGMLPVMYPYQEDAKIEKYSRTHKLNLTVPVEQKAVPGTFDPAAAISTGMAVVDGDGNVSVALANACAMVKFAVPLGEYSKVTLSAVGCEICGPCSANVNSTVSDISIGMGGEETVTLKGDIEGGNIYLIAVVPGVATGGITARLYDKEGNLAGEKTTTNSVTFTRSHILNIGLLPTSTPTWSGSGTASDPYRIKTSAHLKLLAQAFSLRETAKPYAGKYFLQEADINMQEEEITIGNYKDRYRDTDPAWGVPTYFNAVYDGGGYTISNYRLKYISKDGHYYAGLFNCVKDAEIKNLKVRPAQSVRGNLIDGIEDSDSYYNIGMLVGYLSANTTISGCTSLARSDSRPYTVVCTEETSFLETPLTINLGGLIGYISANPGYTVNINGCTNEADLILEKGSNQIVAGGIIGSHYFSSFTINIDRCRNKGSVTAETNKAEAFAGGIIGRITDGFGGDILVHISNCVNEGSITAKTKASKDACAGGMAGSNNSDGWGMLQFKDMDPWVYNSLNNGDIYAYGNDAMAGGIFGYCYDSDTKLALCVNTGHISAGGDPKIGPICATGGDHLWCFWLNQDEFKTYKPGDFYIYYTCKEENAGYPEHIR